MSLLNDVITQITNNQKQISDQLKSIGVPPGDNFVSVVQNTFATAKTNGGFKDWAATFIAGKIRSIDPNYKVPAADASKIIPSVSTIVTDELSQIKGSSLDGTDTVSTDPLVNSIAFVLSGDTDPVVIRNTAFAAKKRSLALPIAIIIGLIVLSWLYLKK